MHTPEFSIIVPTRNRPESLARCVRAIAAMDFAREAYELIVVDDGGRARLEPLLEAWRGRLALTLVRQAQAGPAAARNTGAARARGQYLAFTDDDCLPTPDWLRAIASRVNTEGAVGGSTLNALPHNLYASASDVMVQYLFAYYNPDPLRARFLSTNNLVVPAPLFQAVGGFARAFTRAAGEDREFCARWLEHGYALTYAADAVVYHAHALGPLGFWRQHWNYGRGALLFRYLRAQRQNAPMQVEPRSFYADLLRAPFAHARGTTAWRLAMLMVLAQGANALGFAFEAMRRGVAVSAEC